ncbi:TMV resistance protein N-like isoform X2 [Rutidosis leptorrhynchoides]|uniref:TMV resistance protein N-like isoform X2 n=1 Tax=Rutidosis leptorrhynchoides TaxID=125765 RepID=UPI003A98CFC8
MFKCLLKSTHPNSSRDLKKKTHSAITAMDVSLVASSSTAAPTGRCTYDVFLSFRGEDTRNNFVDHLFAALERAGIYTFKDDEKLRRGKSISPEFMKAIQESMVALVVFSKNYAKSSWCLEELAKIVECKHLKVLPVFYNVDPSDVRSQKGSIFEAFKQHELKFADDMYKVKRWRKALETVAGISGWDVAKTASGREAESIKQIVRTILSSTESHLAEDLIGMESRVRDVKSLLDKGCDDVCIIGIWGMGGIGKTTIVRAVYRQISHEFDGSSFLEDVRENGSDKKGLKSLQEKLLSEILMEKHYNVKDCNDGIHHIRRRLGRKKVLVVLDNVDSFKQLEFLAGDREWFGADSRIMVTTRDKHLLSFAQQEYEPALLNHTEAMMLFCKYAFKTKIPPKTYEKVSDAVVSRTGYLPLALKVLGSHFCGGRSLEFWQSALNVLAKIPNEEINEILKISFDGLNSFEKKIFTYIACFFKGRERSNVTKVLDSFGFEPESGIIVLIERSLLSISRNGCIHMHDLIQEMGRSVVRECYPNKMVWDLEEIEEVMVTIDKYIYTLMICWLQKSKKVEALVDMTHYHFSDIPTASCKAEVLKSMDKLRLLDVKGKFTSAEPKYFPQQLRWLTWFTYPFESLRIRSNMPKLVGFEMQSGLMKQLQIVETVILPNLKSMDLSFSYSLKRFPDITGVPNLEHLNLSFCSELEEVHHSVLLHEKIIHLQLISCVSLRILPSPIRMKSLQSLHLNGCSSLEIFPNISEEMGRPLVLDLDGCDRICGLPLSIGFLTGLVILTKGKNFDVNFVKHNQIILQYIEFLTGDVSSLRVVDVKPTKFVGKEYSTWPSWGWLDFDNKFTRLFNSLFQFSHVKYADLSCCINLKELHDIPFLIQVLSSDCCTSLRKMGDLLNKYKWLIEIPLLARDVEDQGSSSQLTNLSLKSLVERCAAMNHQLSFIAPGGRTIPNWYLDRQFCCQVALNLPKNLVTNILGFAICGVSRVLDSDISYPDLRIHFSSLKDKLVDWSTYVAERTTHFWMVYIHVDSVKHRLGISDLDEILVWLQSDNHIIVECGVHVVYQNIKLMPEIES